MLRDYALIRAVERQIEKAVRRVCDKFDGISDEDDFSSRLLEGIEGRLDGHQFNNTTWSASALKPADILKPDQVMVSARRLSSKGPGSAEARYGADIIIVIDINTPEYTITKGVLIQAKMLDLGDNFSGAEWGALKEQIRKMKTVTNDAHVWLYSKEGVRSIHAQAILGALYPTPDRLYVESAQTFFGSFVKSKYGDDKFVANSDQAMRALQREYDTKHALLVRARYEGRREISS